MAESPPERDLEREPETHIEEVGEASPHDERVAELIEHTIDVPVLAEAVEQQEAADAADTLEPSIDPATRKQTFRNVVGVNFGGTRTEVKVREFDIVARTADSEFQILLPDPGPTPDERVTALARSVAEEIARHGTSASGDRPGLAFGYAIYPSDGADRETLTARTQTARIRMV